MQNCDGNAANGCETDVATDPANCGTCGKACVVPNASAACVAGQCAVGNCASGRSDCNGDVTDGCEAALASDPANCGSCGKACPTGATCQSGACNTTCAKGTADCNGNPADGCETPIGTTSDCAFCGDACQLPNAASQCVQNVCSLETCNPGFANCDAVAANGCEASVTNDPSNCGSCGNVCPSGPHASPVCSSGCGIVCDPGWGDCDSNPSNGCETNLDTSSSCGGCGVTCTSADPCRVPSCTSGTCSTSPGNDGAACDDGDACTSGDVCSSGACTGTSCPSGVCTSLLSAFQGADDPGWVFNGSAYYDSASNTVVLTDAVNSEAGTVIWQDPIAADTFSVQFDFVVTTTGGRADGLGFFMQTNGPFAVGNAGGGLGMAALSGYGAELDIYDNQTCGDADGNHTAVDSLASCSGMPTHIAVSGDLFGSVGDIGDDTWRTVLVQVSGGQMSITIDGVSILSNVALPGYVAGTPWYLGFAGGTGGLAARQAIANVYFAFPGPMCL